VKIKPISLFVPSPSAHSPQPTVHSPQSLPLTLMLLLTPSHPHLHPHLLHSLSSLRSPSLTNCARLTVLSVSQRVSRAYDVVFRCCCCCRCRPDVATSSSSSSSAFAYRRSFHSCRCRGNPRLTLIRMIHASARFAIALSLYRLFSALSICVCVCVSFTICVRVSAKIAQNITYDIVATISVLNMCEMLWLLSDVKGHASCRF